MCDKSVIGPFGTEILHGGGKFFIRLFYAILRGEVASAKLSPTVGVLGGMYLRTRSHAKFFV